jgi:putative peptide zinc metalloprotease protein
MTIDSSQQEAVRWRLVPGVELLGPVTGSGLVQETYLVQRRDGQVIQISALLNLILKTAESEPTTDKLALDVSSSYGRELDRSGLNMLIEQKLRPLGLIEDATGTVPMDDPAPTARPLLALRLKGAILPARAVNGLAAMLRPVFFPPVVIFALVALVGLDIALFVSSSLMSALEQVLVTPTLLLGLFAMMVVGAVIHELGHATACKYGGAEPGVIGFGVYLVFPAFFTNVTDSYRLNRSGKLRTDLGGLYFNVWCVLLAGAGFLLTGNGILLLFVITTQIMMLQQLPPTIRLDGYFVLADLAGVPDLFSRVGPVLRSIIPGRPVDPRVTELRPAARRIVKVWVLTVVPALVLLFAWLLWNLPFIVGQASSAVVVHAHALSAAWAGGRPVEVVLSSLSIFLLVLPIAGIVVIIPKLFFDGLKAVRRFRKSRNTEAVRDTRLLPAAGPARAAGPAGPAAHMRLKQQARHAEVAGPMGHLKARRTRAVAGGLHHRMPKS